MRWRGGGVCLHLELKYETQKQHRGKKKGEKNENRVLSSNQITSLSSAGRPPPPSSLPIPPLRSILCLSTPLSQRHAEAVGSLCRVWGSARAVRGCYLGLLQQTRSSSPKGRGKRGQSQESRSAQLSQPGIRSAFQARGREHEKVRHRQERTAAERERERVIDRDK